MTDSRIQQLKRAWEASGSTEAEAAWLRERLRVGELSKERLDLAGALGSPAARVFTSLTFDQVVSDLAFWLPAPDSEPDYDPEELGLPDPRQWQFGLESAHRCLRAMVGYQERAPLAMEALDWVDRRILGVESARGLVDLVARLEALALEEANGYPPDILPQRSVLAELLEGRVSTDFLIELVHLTTEGNRIWLTDALAEVIPWALGYSDPVRERVEARQREAAGE